MTTPPAPPPTPDPFIDEVRALKKAASERFGNDLNRIAEHLRAIEQKQRANVIAAPTGQAHPPGRVA